MNRRQFIQSSTAAITASAMESMAAAEAVIELPAAHREAMRLRRRRIVVQYDANDTMWSYWKLNRNGDTSFSRFRDVVFSFADEPGSQIDAIWWVLLVSAPAGVAKFLFGLSESDILILIANATLISTVLILDALRHSHLPVSFGPLDRYLVSPHMHQLHHSVKVEHWDKNMGDKLFIWDRLFGTGYIPARDEAITYGLGRGAEVDQLYTTAWGVFVTPVVNAVKVLRHGPIERPPALDLLRGGSRTVPTETLAP